MRRRPGNHPVRSPAIQHRMVRSPCETRSGPLRRGRAGSFGPESWTMAASKPPRTPPARGRDWCSPSAGRRQSPGHWSGIGQTEPGRDRWCRDPRSVPTRRAEVRADRGPPGRNPPQTRQRGFAPAPSKGLNAPSVRPGSQRTDRRHTPVRGSFSQQIRTSPASIRSNGVPVRSNNERSRRESAERG